MKFARACLKADDRNPVIDQLAAAGELDLLQLDYLSHKPENYSVGFFQQMRSLHRYFYMEPSLRLITNAGGGQVVACVEALGGYLREHDDSAMPITTVRGDNLLPRLAELSAEGVEFTDETTGEPLLESQEPPVAVQVELGAGPLATAWSEGSRMIVAGSYDVTAPSLGAAVSQLQLAWTDYDTLAAIAVVAQAMALVPAITEALAPGQITLQPDPQQECDAEELVRKLTKTSDSGIFRQADVVADLKDLTMQALEYGGLRLNGIRGQRPPETWRVKFTFTGGNVINSAHIVERWTRVPRDAVNVSVDTRPAAEWL